MGRYNEQKSAKQVSIWKIIFGVAFGIVLAGMLTTFGFIFFAGAAIWGFNESINKQTEQSIQLIQSLSNREPLHVVPITTAPLENSQSQGFPQIPLIPKSREELVREQSKKAYVEVRKIVEDFKSQYKKPPECYDLKDRATRMHCANAFIRAREAYEALNK